MRADPKLTTGRNLLWIRFFLLAVFATMYVRDHARPAFHEALGVDIEDYDRKVIRLTSEISRQCFPIELDLDNEAFWADCRKLADIGERMTKAQKQGLFGKVRKGLLAARAGLIFAGMYIRPVKRHDLPADVRLQPVW
jgi:magnesium-protoporphyrin IX monomethyl ester (oxidative) cyclase